MSGSNSSSNDGLLSSNGSKIRVNSMERFKSDNDELELWISKAVEYASNISKNSLSAIATLGDIDSKLNGLQKVSLSTKWKLTFYDVSVEEYTKRLSENTASSLIKCYSGFKYAELLIAICFFIISPSFSSLCFANSFFQKIASCFVFF